MHIYFNIYAYKCGYIYVYIFPCFKHLNSQMAFQDPSKKSRLYVLQALTIYPHSQLLLISCTCLCSSSFHPTVLLIPRISAVFLVVGTLNSTLFEISTFQLLVWCIVSHSLMSFLSKGSPFSCFPVCQVSEDSSQRAEILSNPFMYHQQQQCVYHINMYTR